MRSRRSTAVSGHSRGVSRGDVAAVRDTGGYQLAFKAVEVAACPRFVVVIWKVDAAVVPGVAIGIETASRLDRDQRRLGNVGRSFKERVHRVRTVLSAIERREQLRRLAQLLK